MEKNCISLKKKTKRKLNEKYISRRPRIQCDKIPRLIFLRPSPHCRSPTPACRAAGHSRRRPSACRPTRPPSVRSPRRTAPARTRSSRWQSRTGGCGRSSGGDSVTALRDRVRWQPDRWVRTVFRWRQCDSPEGQSTVTAGQVGADGLQVATVWQPWGTEYGDSWTGGCGRSSGGDSVTALRDRVQWQLDRWVRTVFRWRQCDSPEGQSTVTAGQVGADGLQVATVWQPWGTEYGDSRTGGCGRSSGSDSVTALRDRVRWQPDRWVWTVFRWRQCDSPEGQSTVTAGQVGADGLQVATVWQPSEGQSTVTAGQVGLDGLQVATVWQPWGTEYGDSRTGGCGRSSGGDSVTALRDRVRWQLDRWVRTVFRWRQCDSPEGQSTVTAGQVGADGLQVATVWQPWETEYGDSRTGGCGRSSGGDSVTALRDRVRWQPDRWVRTVFRWRQCDSPEGQSTVTAGQVGADGLQVATVWQPWETEYGDSRTGGCGRSSGGDSVTAPRDRVRWQPDRWVRTVFRWRQRDSPERQSTVTAGQVGADGLQVATVWQPWGTEYGDSRTGGWDGLQVATVWQPWETEYGDSRTGGCGRSSGGDSVTALRDRVRWQPDRWVRTVFRWRQCDSPEGQSTVTAGQVGADGLQVATVWQPWGTEYGDSWTGGCGRSSGGDSVTALRDRVRWQPDRWVWTVFRWRQCDSPEGQSTVTDGQVGADGLQVATVWQPWETEYGDSRTGGSGRSSGGDSVTALRDRVRWQTDRWVRTVFRWRQCDSPEGQSTVTAGQVGADGLQVATVWQPWGTEYGDSRTGGSGRSSGGDSVTALRDRVRWQPDRWVRTVFRWRQCDSPEGQSTVTAGQVGADGLQVATVWQPWGTGVRRCALTYRKTSAHTQLHITKRIFCVVQPQFELIT